MQSLMTISDLEVDRIIQKVLVRSSSKPYNYLKPQHSHQLTPGQHIWHYQLQQQNLELKNKIKEMKLKCRRKQESLHRHQNLNKQIQQIKRQLEEVLNQNTQIQKDINRLRIRNSRIQQNSRKQLQQSINRSKGKRQCQCESSGIRKMSPHHQESIRNKKHTLTSNNSPIKNKQKVTQNASINCNMTFAKATPIKQEIQRKKQAIKHLKQLISNQQHLIGQYKQEIKNKQNADILQRKYTMASTSRLAPMKQMTPKTAFKHQSSIGSIVKVRRTTTAL